MHSRYDRSALPAETASKTVVIPHGEYGHLARRAGGPVDVAAARAAIGARDGDVVALLFGQLRRDKGLRDLLEASAQVPEVRVVIAGQDAGALDEVAGLLKDARLGGRVLLQPGFATETEMANLFAASDVVALPDQRASASGVLLLAYGFERPVVSYAVGGLPEYIEDGLTGWLCDSAGPAGLERTLRRVVAEGRAECTRRGKSARAYSDELFSWDRIAALTTDLYEDVLSLS